MCFGGKIENESFLLVMVQVSQVLRGGRVVVCDLVGGCRREGFFEHLGLRDNSGIV